MRVRLSTICRASVHEEWTLNVPDDIDLADEKAVMELLEQQGDTVQVIDVRNVEVYDESDRSFNHVEVVPPEPGNPRAGGPVCTVCGHDGDDHYDASGNLEGVSCWARQDNGRGPLCLCRTYRPAGATS